jgi:S1-C subfamily serine protease
MEISATSSRPTRPSTRATPAGPWCLDGEVVGINTWITSPTGGSIGLGFAIPINNARKAIDDFISKGSVEYGWLGVSIVTILKETADDMGLSGTQGAFVTHLFRNSPAEKGGLLPGDFVTSLNGRSITSSEDLVQMVGDLPVGKESVFVLIRQKKEMTIKVIITARGNQKDIVDQGRMLWPGLAVLPLGVELRRELKIDEAKRGVIVQAVEARTAAATAGVKPGDFILRINGRQVASLLDFYATVNVRAGEKVELVIERDGKEVALGLQR